jgi:hypothetical protein
MTRAPTNGGAPLDRGEALELQLRHLNDADLERLARAIVKEHGQRRRESRAMRRENPRVRAWWRECPICGSTACVGAECREAERRRSRWRHVPEPATTGGGAK